MYNPFPLITPELLNALVQAGHRYFVRQTYPRGRHTENGNNITAFLLTHYTDKSKADIHFKALAEDANRFLYEVDQPLHLQRLQTAAAQPTGYGVYAPLLEKVWRPTEKISRQVKKYVDEYMNWQPKKSEGIRCELFLQFGELFITLKWKSSTIKIPLSEIERL